MPLKHKRMGSYGLPYALRKIFCLFGHCTGSKNNKFFAAMPHKKVGLTHAAINYLVLPGFPWVGDQL